MTETARHFIEAFQNLPDLEKREVLAALLRESSEIPYGPPSDADLVAAADEVFQDFDAAERDQ